MSRGRAAAAIAYGFLVLMFSLWTWVDGDELFCSTVAERSEIGTATETSSAADGELTGTKVTTAEPSEKTTTTCQGLSGTQAALLLLPVLVLVWPAIKGFNIAGIGIDLREVQRAAAEEATEQVIRVVFEKQVGDTVRQAYRQTENVDPESLPPLP